MVQEAVLTPVIAAAALFVSLVALYAQFFRRRVRLLGLLVDKPYDERPSWFQYALINTGDVAMLVHEITCESERATFLTACEQTPGVIAPGEVKLFRIDFKPKDLEPAAVHFSGIAANGKVFEGTHRVLGSGRIVPRDDSVYWRLFPITR
jgi:hypothetical protein